jgi:hypothetical protein
MAKSVIYVPKDGCAAEWRFVPTASLRKKYPDAPGSEFGMDLQEGEVLVLEPTEVVKSTGNVVLTVKEGRLELLDAASNWSEAKRVPDDAIEWDITRIIEAWSSDD